MKFSKPGQKKKKNTQRQPPPKEKYCRRCGEETGTERVCHYEGMFKHKYGKGTGKKVDDNLVSMLCLECDQIMANKPDKNDHGSIIEFEVEWCWLIIEYRLL